MISGTTLVGIVVFLLVISYAAGYFNTRRVTDFSLLDLTLPEDSDGSLRALYNAYGIEVWGKYARNHAKRVASKRLREFGLASVHFFVFMASTGLTSTIDRLEVGYGASIFMLGLSLLAMALKAGQLTSSQEDLERKESFLLGSAQLVNRSRDNVFANCPREVWVDVVNAREDQPSAYY